MRCFAGGLVDRFFKKQRFNQFSVLAKRQVFPFFFQLALNRGYRSLRLPFYFRINIMYLNNPEPFVFLSS